MQSCLRGGKSGEPVAMRSANLENGCALAPERRFGPPTGRFRASNRSRKPEKPTFEAEIPSNRPFLERIRGCEPCRDR